MREGHITISLRSQLFVLSYNCDSLLISRHYIPLHLFLHNRRLNFDRALARHSEEVQLHSSKMFLEQDTTGTRPSIQYPSQLKTMNKLFAATV